jgi:hypothetical protein
VRVRVPYDSGGKRLHLHDVPKEVNLLAVVQRRECKDDAHQDARRRRGWRSARHERLRSEREIIREILPILIVRPLHPSLLGINLSMKLKLRSG